MRKRPAPAPAAGVPGVVSTQVPAPVARPPPGLAAPHPAAPFEGPSPTVEWTMLIESTPPGALIVVDGRPVGKAPVRLAVPVTPLGFFRDYVEIRARFIATDPTETTSTTTEEFTPREKAPAVLYFTTAGVRRAEQ